MKPTLVMAMMIALGALTTGCRATERDRAGAPLGGSTRDGASVAEASVDAAAEPTRRLFDSLVAAGTPHATFAGGCFWCVETAFDPVDGVVATIAGYTGGTTPDPTYAEVSSGGTGHAETVTVFYDSARVSYARLLEVFWRNIDPLTADRQFCDRGTQYRSAVFYHDDDQRRIADSSKRALDASRRFGEPIVTEIAAATTVTPAEEYHQDFATKNPERYEEYRLGCRRDQRLEELWGRKK